jgi:hypothetical protein
MRNNVSVQEKELLRDCADCGLANKTDAPVTIRSSAEAEVHSTYISAPRPPHRQPPRQRQSKRWPRPVFRSPIRVVTLIPPVVC